MLLKIFSEHFFINIFKLHYVIFLHSTDVTWATWRLKSPATRPFVQRLAEANNMKETSKIRATSATGLLWGESTVERWIPLTKGQ